MKGSRKRSSRASTPRGMRGSTSASARSWSRRAAKRRSIGGSFGGFHSPIELCTEELGSDQARATVELVAFGDQEVLELPRVGRVELRSVVAAEEVGVMLERGPGGGRGDEGAQVRLAHAEHEVVGQVLG